MQHYRLLRNNRETGPYTQQDLIDLGLKAYDLIWMEGKSSSWKYPSEIESLKEYAPPATEDFYVLFHTPKLVKKSTPPPASIPAFSGFSANPATKTTNRRYVSVILPASQAIGTVTQTPLPALQAATPPGSQEKHDFGIERPNDDSKIAIVNSSHYKAKNRYIIAAALLALLTIGIYLGTSTKNSIAPSQDIAETAAGSMVSLTAAAPTQPEAQESKKEVPALKPNKVLDFAAVKRYVQVTFPEYQVGFFGGISGLQVTVKNNGPLKLKNVVIAVDFLGKNKEILHTENIVLTVIDPRVSTTVSVPESPDGIAVQTRIIGINDLSAQ